MHIIVPYIFQQELRRWRKDPAKHACEAYLNMRKELSILVALKHDNIVPLVGISTHPMCLILSLAPLGALSSKLAEFKRKGVKLPVDVVTEVVLQVRTLKMDNNSLY